MNLISILVFAVAVLSVLTSSLALFGASKTDRLRMVWYFVAMFFGAIWAIACVVFLSLPVDADSAVPYAVAGIYVSGALMMVGLLGYGAGKTTLGKVALGFALAYVVFMTVLLINNPALMFESYELSTRGNVVHLVNGWAYWSYSAFYAICSFIALFSVWNYSKRTRIKRIRQGEQIFLAGWICAGVVASIFNMALPLMGQYSTIWVGPLALSIFAVLFYYTLLKFRVVSMSSRWLRAISAVVLMLCGAIVYMMIFYLIFTALFKIPNPSASVLVLNFLMIVIVLLLMPVINELKASINSLIMVGQVDIAYVIKKLNRLAARNVDLRELAGFLADHLHFAYIGFIINGKLYGSKSLAVSADELSQIIHMKSTVRGEVWQEPSKTVQKILDDLDLKAVAELRNAKGKAFGQIVVGKPLGKSSFERRDLIQLDMIINLVATVIDSEKHIRV